MVLVIETILFKYEDVVIIHMPSSIPYAIDEAFLDTYGHVNFAQQMLLVDEGRKALQAAIGFDDERLKGRGIGLFVNQASIQYHRQMHPGETVIHSQFQPYEGGARIHMRHQVGIGETYATAYTEHVCVDIQTGRPKKPLDDLINAINHDLEHG